MVHFESRMRSPASPASSTAQEASTGESVIRSEPSPTDATPSARKNKPEPAVLKVARSAKPRTARVGRSDVENFGDDVTVRHFNYKPVAQQKRAGANRVAYI